MQRVISGTLMIASFGFAATSIETPPVITSVAFGGGGGVYQFASTTSGIVVGQSYAESNSQATSGSGASTVTLEVEHGFWIGLNSLTPSSIQPPLATNHLTSIHATFLSHSIAVDLKLAQRSPVSIQVVDLQGRQAISTWKETLSSGSHNIELPLVGFSQNLILKVQAGQNTQTFRFTSNPNK